MRPLYVNSTVQLPRVESQPEPWQERMAQSEWIAEGDEDREGFGWGDEEVEVRPIFQELTWVCTLHVEDDGSYWAEVKELPGCFASGHTLDELRDALIEAIGMYCTERGRRNERRD